MSFKWNNSISGLQTEIPKIEKTVEVSLDPSILDCMADNPLCPKPKDNFQAETSTQEIYLDNNATHPVLPAVIDVISEAMRKYANASSNHQAGKLARKALENAREEISEALGISDSSRLFFTSGGTEANNLAIQGIPLGCAIATSTVEHKSVSSTMYELHRMKRAAHLYFIRVNENGMLDENMLSEFSGKLVSLVHVNNETGVVFPLDKYRSILSPKTLLHSDMSQTLGKVEFSGVGDLDMVTFASHKMGGPVGIGALYVKPGINLNPIMWGGQQEFAVRPGTYNVPLALGWAEAVKRIKNVDLEAIRGVRDHFESLLGCKINAGGSERAVNTSSVVLEGSASRRAVEELSAQGIYVSYGSACGSAIPAASHVLVAMGLSEKEALATIRVSLNRWNTRAEVEKLASVLKSLN